MTKASLIFLIIVLVVIFGILAFPGIFHFGSSPQNQNVVQQTACTMEAKICPDGSAVGRTGPHCEFSPCPQTTPVKIDTSTWKTSSDSKTGISFKYPETFGRTFITASAWPPVLSASASPFTCKASTPDSHSTGQTMQRTIAGDVYCVTFSTEGAAGSVYSDYAYSTPKSGKVITLKFTLKFPQCANYDEPKKTQCENERKSLGLDGLVNSIMQTVSVK